MKLQSGHTGGEYARITESRNWPLRFCQYCTLAVPCPRSLSRIILAFFSFDQNSPEQSQVLLSMYQFPEYAKQYT